MSISPTAPLKYIPALDGLRRALRIMPLHFFYISTLLFFVLARGPSTIPAVEISAAEWMMYYFDLGNFAISTHGKLPLEFVIL